MGIKLTQQQFIERAIAVHSDRYDYGSAVFTGANNKIQVTCRVHGNFEQRAMDHMKGRGCALCNERQQLTVEQFIQRATDRHSGKYTYDRVQYTNVSTKVEITCKHHGSFFQTPKDHMRENGCPTCSGTEKVTVNQFVERARAVHGARYDYELVNMAGMNTNVDIKCAVHGSFNQRPADHLGGAGCPACGAKQRGKYTEEYFRGNPSKCNEYAQLYLVTFNDQVCKIGITKKRNVKQRFPGVKLNVEHTRQTTLHDAFIREQLILNKYQQYRYDESPLPEQRFTGWTECFPISLLPALKQEFEES